MMGDGSGGSATPATPLRVWALAGLIPVAVGTLYHTVLAMWWTADEPMVLWHVSLFGPGEYFFKPEVWKSFNPASLTPWMLLSFDLDRSVFGLDPAGFYLHQLIALASAGVALWFCLRLYLSPAPAVLGSIALLVAPATAEIASNLSTRHYVEGLMLACLSSGLFVTSLRRSSWRLNLLAAGCYALALTAKEIFAPLPVVLLLLPEGDLRPRLRRLAPFVVVLVTYVAWRRWMLGALGGGYRDRVLPSATEASAWLRSMADGGGLSVAGFVIGVFAVVMVAAVALGRSRPAWRWFWLGFAVCAALPVAPVLHVYSARHAFAVAVLVAAAAAALADRLIELRLGTLGRWSVGVAGITLLVAAGSAARSRLPSVDQVQRVRVEGEEVLRGGDPSRVVVSPLMPYWHFFGLLQLRDDVLGLPPGPGVVADGCLVGLLDNLDPPEDRHVLVFDPKTAKLDTLPEPIEPCRLLDDAALTVDIRFTTATNLTSWQLGPYVDGRYTVLWAMADNSLVGIDVPPRGERRGNLAFQMGVELVVAYRSPEGWRTLTPRLAGHHRDETVAIDYARDR